MSDSVQVHPLVLGLLQTNCYIVVDDQTKKGVVIDPADEGETIFRFICKHGWKVDQVLLTHGHFDHIGGIVPLKKEIGADIWIHEQDVAILEDPGQNLSFLLGDAYLPQQAYRFLEEGRSIEFGTGKLDVIHTPGHTPGSVSFVGDHFAIVGDTLFRNSVGRTDFPYSSSMQLMESIQKKLFELDDDVIVYPGHGPETTIGRERRKNPFVAKNQSRI